MLTIGQLSSDSGVKIETIRYYERIGLLAQAKRTPGGHRFYNSDDLRRLVSVRDCRDLGFSISELREILNLVDTGDYSCIQVKELTSRHIADIQFRIAQLRKLEDHLTELSSRCSGSSLPDCPVVDTLFRS